MIKDSHWRWLCTILRHHVGYRRQILRFFDQNRPFSQKWPRKVLKTRFLEKIFFSSTCHRLIQKNARKNLRLLPSIPYCYFNELFILTSTHTNQYNRIICWRQSTTINFFILISSYANQPDHKIFRGQIKSIKLINFLYLRQFNQST